MQTVQLNPDEENAQVRSLYESAFPEEEQIPWGDLMRLVKTMSLDFAVYREDGNLVGLTIVYPRTQFNWFWYFAVQEDMRGKGYGQQILSQLKKRYKGQTFVMDIESPHQICNNSQQRHRRHAFYLRNGFRDTHVYRQYDEIEMTIMMIGDGDFTINDWNEITEELRKHWSWED